MESFILSKTKKLRTGASINAYLILRKEDSVLLHLRKNTGYCDGLYGLIAGHVEDNESASAAIMREAYEEAGIVLEHTDLKIAHVMHRKSNRFNVDIFFISETWQGEMTNKEPEKCASLEYFPLHQLPFNTIDVIAQVLRKIINGEFYSEWGWQ